MYEIFSELQGYRCKYLMAGRNNYVEKGKGNLMLRLVDVGVLLLSFAFFVIWWWCAEGVGESGGVDKGERQRE